MSGPGPSGPDGPAWGPEGHPGPPPDAPGPGYPPGPGSDPEFEPEPEPHIYGTPPLPPVGRPGGRPRRAGRPWRKAVAIVVVVAVLVVAGGVYWVSTQASPSGSPGRQVIVTVHTGTGVNQLASTLASKGVIGSALAYKVWGLVHSEPGVQPGTYAFRTNSSFAAVNSVIGTGPNVFPLEIPAGFTVSEVAARVGQLPDHQAAAFLRLATGGTVRSPWQPAGSNNLDGLLGTGEYLVVPGESDTQLLTSMIDRFDALAKELDLNGGAAKLDLTPYQVITIASIVQKEGFITKNMGRVARVILNRLANEMPLQMDSTVLYAEGRDGGPVTSKDLRIQSPYNSYLNKGLTPTPICFPSRTALEAALHPPPGSWLFFVVVESDGTEAFADTFAQQQANEALAQQRGLS